MKNYLIHTVSAITVDPEDQLTNVVNLLRETVTPLLSSHNKIIPNLASVMASALGGASNYVLSTNTNTINDDNSNGSTSTYSVY